VKYQSHTTNPTEIKRINRSDVDLSVGDKRESFTVHKLEIQKLEISKDLPVWVIARSGFTEERLSLGTADKLVLPMTGNLSALDPIKPLQFRIIIFDPDSKVIVASCEGITARNDTDEAESVPLLPVEQQELGERLWRLCADQGVAPVLYVNNDPDLGMVKKLRLGDDPVVRALILPEAIQQALEHVAVSEEEWRSPWLTFIAELGQPSPDEIEEKDSSEISEWAMTVVDVWLKKNPFKRNILLWDENNE
jgi:hypothetical protein